MIAVLLYPVKRGATTIWEKWDAVKEDGTPEGSLNHYSYGAIVGWLFSTAAGIEPAEPGYRKIRIAPHPGGSLAWAEAEMNTANGHITSRWEIKDDTCIFDMHVPVNTHAELILPVPADDLLSAPDVNRIDASSEQASFALLPGSYRFVVKWKKSYRNIRRNLLCLSCVEI